MIDKRVGKRIKQRREQLGLTQEQFAEKLGVATNYISTIERGASFPRNFLRCGHALSRVQKLYAVG